MARPITDTLRSLRGGVFLDEASDALADLVNRIMECGGTGKIVLELSLKKASRGSGALIVSDKITVKQPKSDAIETMFFATPEGNLVTEDPRQQNLSLRRVEEAPIVAPKVVNAD